MPSVPTVPQPLPSLRVSDADRHRATEALKDAYCEGRIDEVDLDHRLALALVARTRGDLQASLRGLAIRPRPLGTHPDSRPGTVGGGLAHLSGLFTWILGPLLVHALSAPGGAARREAARAFNFQLVSSIAFVLTVVAGGILLPEAVVAALVGLGWLGWATLTVVGGARVLSGQPWVNPVLRVVRWEALDSRGR